MKIISAAFAASLLAGVAMPSSAAVINAPVPGTHYISFGGNDWAWAMPCPATGGACGDGSALDLSFQGAQGWRLPTLAELAAGPTPADFGTATNFKCASAYFSNYSHCDYSDAVAGAIFGSATGGNWYDDTWVIRTVNGAVPEPASWALMIGGLGLAGALMRRRAKTVSFA
jgi:hypothetical protein